MRIVAGKFRGTPLATPKDQSIRPTSDRVREALFNILAHGLHDFELEGARVLDLFAGTGTLGLEALSRGAKFCLFVEHSASARALIRRNVEHLGVAGITKIYRRDATKMGGPGSLAPFDLAFLDPPYGNGYGELALAAARDQGWLLDNAICVLEESADAAIAIPGGFEPMDQRTYGDTQILILRNLLGTT